MHEFPQHDMPIVRLQQIDSIIEYLGHSITWAPGWLPLASDTLENPFQCCCSGCCLPAGYLASVTVLLKSEGALLLPSLTALVTTPLSPF